MTSSFQDWCIKPLCHCAMLAIIYGLAPYTLIGTQFLAGMLQTFWIRLPYCKHAFFQSFLAYHALLSSVYLRFSSLDMADYPSTSIKLRIVIYYNKPWLHLQVSNLEPQGSKPCVLPIELRCNVYTTYLHL